MPPGLKEPLLPGASRSVDDAEAGEPRAAAGEGGAAGIGGTGVGRCRPPRSSSGSSFGGAGRGRVSPAERWQAAAHHALAYKRITDAAAARARVLPGYDVKREGGDEFAALYAHIKARARIAMIDYSRDNVEVADGLGNSDLPRLLAAPRPEWSKVRWLNIQGLSWDIVSELARRFDLHPLAVEDTMHIPQRIKADFYEQHLFVSMARFSIKATSSITDASVHGGAAAERAARTIARAGSLAGLPFDPFGVAVVEGGAAGGASPPPGGSPLAPQLPAEHPSRPPQFRSAVLAASLSARPRRSSSGWLGSRGARDPALVVPMVLSVEQVFIFLMRDGTLISIFTGDADDIYAPIVERLRSLKTLLTDSEDASFLGNVLLDQVVDATMPMVQVYAKRISALERRVLTETRPRAEYTKELHLLSNDCTSLRRALIPAQHLVHRLQSSPVITLAEREGSVHGGNAFALGLKRVSSVGGNGSKGGSTIGDDGAARPLLSPLTRLYLSDVLDHVDTLVEDMESLALQAKELIDYIYNSVNHQSNTAMAMLSIVNTVFLPLTFLAGVFGTNFESITAYQWSEGFWLFWALCLIVTVAFVVVLRMGGLLEP